MTIPTQIPLDFSIEQCLADIETIHSATAVYTAAAEIEALLDRLGWPEQVETLLDPGAGNGGFIVAALGRLLLPVNDAPGATRRVKGYEFHPGAVKEAREAVYAHLIGRGWSHLVAQEASHAIIEERDFLLFVVPRTEGLPAESLVPVVDTQDIDASGVLRPTRRWAIVTGTSKPDARILAHLASTLDRMPTRGRRRTPWLPPETFSDRLPLAADAVLIPRIAKRLRPVRLPAGHLPIDHQLIVISQFDPDRLIEILEDPVVQAQAEVLAAHIDGGYREHTVTLLRQLVIPNRYLI
jgi:hypothetical protein